MSDFPVKTLKKTVCIKLFYYVMGKASGTWITGSPAGQMWI